MKKHKNKLNLTRGLFWDVENEQLEWEKDKVYIIGRVLDMGSWEDIRKVFDRYGEETIKKCIVKVRELHRRTEILWSKYFNIPLEKLSSWQRKRSKPGERTLVKTIRNKNTIFKVQLSNVERS